MVRALLDGVVEEVNLATGKVVDRREYPVVAAEKARLARLAEKEKATRPWKVWREWLFSPLEIWV
jgi:hypothetical protein